MNLTEIGGFNYDANDPGQPKTPAQIAVDQMRTIGVRHIVLNPRAMMNDPRGSNIIPMTGSQDRAAERVRYKKLIDYIHAQGMTVGIRPIFFVIGPDGSFPYIEILPNGEKKIWWHGNIQPRDPDAWFQSFKNYLDIYMLIAKINKVEEFTIGAELYSMTVGIEDQWTKQQFGFPSQWLSLLRYTRGKLGKNVRLMYDVNFTDDSNDTAGSAGASGGELERWRYRLVDLARPTNPKEAEIWNDLVSFWKELDAIGIDMYRSLASPTDKVPAKYDDLVKLLRVRADAYAGQLDSAIVEIDATINHRSRIMMKEVGFRSATNAFVDPFNYATGKGTPNIDHQAAAYEAVLKAFWSPSFPWFFGATFWDVSANPSLKGAMDTGFSPLDKAHTESVLKAFFD
jgi:hypothetical protein